LISNLFIFILSASNFWNLLLLFKFLACDPNIIIMASLIERDKVSYKASRISEFQAFFAFLRGQHYKGSGELPIFNNITSNNWQRKVRLVRIYKFWDSNIRTIKSSSCCQLEHLLRKEFDKDTLFPYLEWSLDLTCSMSVISSKVFIFTHDCSRLALADRSHKAT
jgi:hypothetical protein